MSIKRNSIGYFTLAIIATTLWGSAFAGGKIAFEYMPPIMLSGLRFALAGILCVPIVWITKTNYREQVKQHWRFIALFAFVQTFIQYGMFYMGLDLVPGAISAIVVGAGPLFIAVMAHITLPDDKLNVRKIAAILLGLSGIVFISLSSKSVTIDNPHFYIGICLLLVSNMVGSYTNIMVVKYGKEKVSPVLLTCVANFTGGVMLFLFSLIVEPVDAIRHILPAEFYLTLLWLAIIPAAGFSIWYYLLSLPEVRVSELNILKFIIPVVGAVLSWVLLPDESPNLQTILGIVIILSGVFLLQLPNVIGAHRNKKNHLVK